MLICHCKAVNDLAIREATRSGAKTVAQVVRCCGAGGECGGCVRAVADIVDEERSDVPGAAAYQALPVAAE